MKFYMKICQKMLIGLYNTGRLLNNANTHVQFALICSYYLVMYYITVFKALALLEC